jgi:type I restriction enzyme M protein
MARSKSPRKERPGKNRQPVSTKQRLHTLIKTVRNKLREDAGMSTDADRIPQLTWMLFLKFLDDHERAQEEEFGDQYAPIIEPPYRWRDWANPEDIRAALKGDELIEFINHKRKAEGKGKEPPGLFPYLAQQSGVEAYDLRNVIGKIFQGLSNRVRSGYVLREVVQEVSGINFNLSEDVHLVSVFYESMLREMRDAAGSSGEFYTPRPVVRLIIDRLAPKLGERVLDPACGTCGFLAETYERLKGEARTPAALQQLQRNLLGIEKKTVPYLLGVMNLLLHGISRPAVDERNTLSSPIREFKDADRVEVIATNPPFGGEEEAGILNNFPEGMRTKETAILYFEYVMARLKRPGGRCGVVLPNGFLFGGGVAAQVRKMLLERFNLHTIVRLPSGVFAPYTDIPTNLLFFEAGDPDSTECCTREIWYYEQPLPDGRKKYSKTNPLDFEEFRPLIEWWDSREENERAWKVAVEEVVAKEFNLDVKNPNGGAGPEPQRPEVLVSGIIEKERRFLRIMEEIQALLTAPNEL